MSADTRPDEFPAPGDASRLSAVPARRRLIRSALATPVVLSSLASKPVLGEPLYQCTVSGDASGNLSRSTDQSVCAIGFSPDQWRTRDWPTALTKGVAPKDSCAYGDKQNTSKGTPFNGFKGNGATPLENVFFDKKQTSPKACTLVQTPTDAAGAASMYRILMEPLATDFGVLHLGQVVIASLLNFYLNPLQYGVSDKQIIRMFNAVYKGGKYELESTNTSLMRAQVIKYLEILY